jgi:hypothetical protein
MPFTDPRRATPRSSTKESFPIGSEPLPLVSSIKIAPVRRADTFRLK